MIDQIKGWQMADAVLLFLVGHRPLAFVAGQGLQLLAPLAALVGAESVDEWAAVLSCSEGVAQLEEALRKG